MLEQEMRRKIFNKLEAMDETLAYNIESLAYNIESLCECRSVIRTVLMLYYYDHREDLKESS